MRSNDFSAGILVTSLALAVGCTTPAPVNNGPDSGPEVSGSGGSASGGTSGGSGGGGGSGGSGSGGAQPLDSGIDSPPDVVAMMPIPGTCQPPLDIDHPYEKLSQTGCMDPQNVTKMASRIFAYEVNAPLWSDGAGKTRGIALPPGGKIHVKDCSNTTAATLKMGDECCTLDPNNYPNCLPPADDGRWVMPVGTVVVKNFLFDSKLVETRLFMRMAAKQWVGYSYQWNEAQTEATIVAPDRLSVMFNTGMRTVAWNYPSRKDCMVCHNEPVGSFIGTETVQLNRMVGPAGMQKNQLDSMIALNMFETAPAKKTPLVTPYAIPGQITGPPAGTTIADRALSYLHANCSYCHRPDAVFYNIDFRHDTDLKKRGICSTPPMKGEIGVPGALDLVPGMPAKSVMYLRMSSTSTVNMIRMPQIGTVVVDTDGTKLISDWITSVKAADCPPPMMQ
ncbi:MAG TPA: hypothetical protein VNO55_20390 [Polyangia bacterium]|nr:hypothetical protein [Polyangia bacterium]